MQAPGAPSPALSLPDAAATDRVGAALGLALRPGDALLLSGPLGAGKSALARAAIRARLGPAGAAAHIPSPTWTLAQVYEAGDAEIWHADLYRLSDPSEAAELGLDDALQRAVCLIEWPERLGALRPARALEARLAFAGDGRALTLVPHGDGWARAIEAARAASALAPAGAAALGGRPPQGAAARRLGGGAPDADGGRDRLAALDAFAARGPWAGAARAALAGDASPRRYWRLTRDDGRRAVLMDADPASGEDVRPFAALTGWLRDRGFSAPEILDADAGAGLLLLEDLGDALFARVCADDPGAAPALYAAAADALAALQSAPPPAVATAPGFSHPIPPYDAATLLREARLAVDWWTPAAGEALSADAAAEFDARLADACARPAADRRALALRDFHAENLIWLPQRRGVARVGLLDYQDALAGHPAYDPISLLEDARRDVEPALHAATWARFAAAARDRDPGFDAAAFAADAAALAAQRNLKILGIFARLWLRDGKPAYLDLIPRVWGHLAGDLSHPGLSALRAFVDRHIPAPSPQALARVRAARGARGAAEGA